MSAFRTRLRRFGRSLGIVVPDDIVRENGWKAGDVVEVSLAAAPSARLDSIIGIAPGIADGWKREKAGRR